MFNEKTRDVSDDDAAYLEIDVIRSKDNAQQSNDNIEGLLGNLSLMLFTCIRCVPCTFGETDNDSTSDISESDSRDKVDDDSEPTGLTCYNLCSRPNINYSCLARISETDQLRLNVALSSADRFQRIQVRRDEFKIIFENCTRILVKNSGNYNMIQASDIVLEIKGYSTGSIVRHNARLVGYGIL